MTEKERRYRVKVGVGTYFGVEAVDEEAARQKALDRGANEVLDVEAQEPKYWTHESDLEWDEEKWLTYASWIEQAIETDAIDEWSCSWPDWDLRFWMKPGTNISYEPGNDDSHVWLPCSRDDTINTKLGDENPPGVGELTYISCEVQEDGRMKVNLSFENTQE